MSISIYAIIEDQLLAGTTVSRTFFFVCLSVSSQSGNGGFFSS